MIRFSLFGFPISIHWMFWVTCLLLGGGTSANEPRDFQRLIAWTLAALISILIHELGHAFMHRRFGGRSQIMLVALGGLAIPDRAFSRSQQIIISLAGPVVQICFGLLLQQLFSHSRGDSFFVASFFQSFYFVSIYWALLNLVPIYPLDGGQVLYNVLGPRMGKITFTVGIVCAATLALWLVSRGSIFSTLLFGMLAYENFQRLRGDRPSGMLYPN